MQVLNVLKRNSLVWGEVIHEREKGVLLQIISILPWKSSAAEGSFETSPVNAEGAGVTAFLHLSEISPGSTLRDYAFGAKVLTFVRL
jgi:hypothetical protein